MSRVIERATGAQLLPIADGIDMLGTSWQAHCAADADLRARLHAFRARQTAAVLATQQELEAPAAG